uniref:Aa_trans domain-containing protein n=1 Tax=Macrostomum lignano TaxID=282301 RepID=A0A1I8F9M1_9PLAT
MPVIFHSRSRLGTTGPIGQVLHVGEQMPSQKSVQFGLFFRHANAHCISVALSNSAGSTMSSRLQAESDVLFHERVVGPDRAQASAPSCREDSAASSCAVSYIQDSQLCSQVNCLADACGMLGFSNLQQPNQFYRLQPASFLHAGLATLLALGTPGWLERTACLYWLFGCALSGCLLSAPSPCPQLWMLDLRLLSGTSRVTSLPGRMLKPSKIHGALLLLCLLILLLLGVSPWLDLFSSVGGFVAAVCCALPACCPNLRLLYCCGDAQL